jgi:WD40 repeat protein
VTADVFISYSSHDVERARSLQALLQSPPLSIDVWRDERKLERDWSREIAFALSGADAVVLLWSAHAADSRWVRHEWLTARALEKSILAVLTDSTALPVPLQNLHGLVAPDALPDQENLGRRIAAALSNPPVYDFTVRPSRVRVPLAANSSFVGRGPDLLEMYLSLIGDLNKIGVRSVGIVGMGGIGKTQLAVEFAYRFAFAFQGIHWINAAEEDWVRSFVVLARDGLRLSAQNSDQEWMRALRDYCADHPDLLLVMDNVVDPERLADPASTLGFAPLDLGCNILFTTRRQFDLPGVRAHAVGVLSPDAAYHLLTSRRTPVDESEAAHARAICAAVGFLPLALVLAGAFLVRYPDMTFGDYRLQLTQSRLETIDVQKLSPAKLATRHLAAVRATLESQWEAVATEDARRVFLLAGLLGEGELIPKSRLGLLAGLEQEPDGLVRPVDDACLELQDLSLADAVDAGRALRLHPLVHEFAERAVPDAATERAVAAGRIAAAYADVATLERHFAERGPAGVIDDVSLGVSWSAGGTTAKTLAGLGRILDAESSTFYRFSHQRYPGLFLQQIANRAALVGQSELADRARERLTAGALTHFVTQWRTQSTSPALVRTIIGHDDWVTRVRVSPDGRRLVAVSESARERKTNAVLGIWDLRTGRLIERLDAPDDHVEELEFAGDADRLLTARPDGALCLWDLATGQLLEEVHGHDGAINALTVSQDGRTALTAGTDDRLLVWDLDHRLEPRMVDAADRANVLAMTPQLAWDARSRGTRHKAAIGGGRAVYGSERLLVVVDASNKVVERHTGHAGVLLSVAVTPDGETIVSGGADGTIRIWRLGTTAPLASRRRLGHEMAVLTARALDHAVVTGDDEGDLRLWDLEGGDQLGKWWGVARRDHAIAAQGGQIVLTSASDLEGGEIKALNVSERTEKTVWLTGGRVEFLLLDRQETILAVAGGGGAQIDIIDAADLGAGLGRFLRSLVAPSDRHWIDSAALTPNGTRLVAAASAAFGSEDALFVFDVETAAILASSPDLGASVQQLAVSQDGTRVTYLTTSGTLGIWEPGQQLPPRVIARELGPDSKLATIDDRFAVTSGDQVRLWDLRTCSLRLNLGTCHPGTWHLEIIDDHYALTASQDWTVSLWDLRAATEVAMLALDSEASVATLSPDGTTFVCGDRAGDVYVFRLVDPQVTGYLG